MCVKSSNWDFPPCDVTDTLGIAQSCRDRTWLKISSWDIKACRVTVWTGETQTLQPIQSEIEEWLYCSLIGLSCKSRSTMCGWVGKGELWAIWTGNRPVSTLCNLCFEGVQTDRQRPVVKATKLMWEALGWSGPLPCTLAPWVACTGRQAEQWPTVTAMAGWQWPKIGQLTSGHCEYILHQIQHRRVKFNTDILTISDELELQSILLHT